MKRLIAQSTLWTIALSMLCMPLTAGAEPQEGQTPSVVSPTRGPLPGEGGGFKRRHKRRGQDQVSQNPSPNGQMPDGGNGRPGGWMDGKNGRKQLTPEERRARMERRRARQGQGMQNGAGPGGRKISDEERQARREKRRERLSQGQGMENGAGPGGRNVSDEERQARREKRRERMENRPGRVPGDSNQGSRPVENND
jgi:hypothetical protein